MTNEERRKAAEWFRNRAKNCPMPGARRMYEIATEALEMAIRALEGDGDMISRQAVMKEFSDFVRKSNNSDFAQTPTWNDAVSLVGSMPSAQPEVLDCGSGELVKDSQRLVEASSNDMISRKQAIEAFEPMHYTDWYTPTIIKTLEELPQAQPEKTCCGYDEKELIAFAIACRRNEVDEKDLKTFAQDCEFAWRVMQEEFESKIREAFEKWTGGKSDAD